MTNAADEKQVTKAKHRDKFNRRQLVEDLRELMEIPAARRVLWEILERCKMFETIMTANCYIYYNAALRDFGARLVEDIAEVDDHAYIRLQEEAIERARDGK